MAEFDTVWVVGEDHGLVWDWGSALLPGDLPLDRVTELWLELGTRPHLGTFLKALSAVTDRDLLNLPDFAVAVMGGEGVHVAVRGRFAIMVDAGGQLIQVDGAVSTWAERHIDRAVGLRLAEPSAGLEPRRPIRHGVVPASAITLGNPTVTAAASAAPSDTATTKLASQRHSVVEPEPVADAEPVVESEPVVEREPEPVAVEQREPEPVAVVEREPEPVAVEQRVVEPEPMDEPEPVGQPRAEAEPEPAVDGEPAAAGSFRLALPDSDEDIEVESAVVAAAAAERPAGVAQTRAELGALDGAWNNENSIVDLESAAVRGDGDVVLAPATGIITKVPKPAGPHAVGSFAAAAGGLPLEDRMLVFDDHDGNTVAQFDEPPADEPVRPAAGPAPVGNGVAADPVRASFCPQQHPNPTHRSVCRVCGADVGPGQTTIARPSLGRVRGSVGEVLELTGPIIVGRTPRADRFRGSDPPQLLPLPYKHISANHLQIRTEGWHILAVDLHSRNGTYLRRRGQQPTRLLETPVPLVTGDVLDLGHGVHLSFEDLP